MSISTDKYKYLMNECTCNSCEFYLDDRDNRRTTELCKKHIELFPEHKITRVVGHEFFYYQEK